MIRSIPAVLAVLAAAIAVSSCSATGSSHGFGPSLQAERAAMTTGGKAFAPPAFYEFCREQNRLCSTSGGAGAVTLTAAREAELKAVNDQVNRRIRERSDPSAGDGPDRWRLPTTEGDCEDFAILKKAELLKRGWPASALLLTVGTAAGQGHTVLTVRTDKGDLILDNFKSAIKPWTKTSYRFFARQVPGNGRQWERILGGGAR